MKYLLLLLLVSCIQPQLVGPSAIDSGTPVSTSFNSGYGYYVLNDGGAALSTLSAGTATTKYENSFSIVKDSQGRYVLAGLSSAGNVNEMIIWRLTSTGELDSSLGSGNGYILSDEGISGAGGAAPKREWGVLQIDSNGKFVVVGCANTQGSNWEQYCPLTLWRFNSDGSKDTSFGGGDGYVVYEKLGTGFEGGTGANRVDYVYYNSFHIDSNGKYVIGGLTKNAAGLYRNFVARFSTDGTLDTSFGGGDGYITSVNSIALYGITVDSSDRVIMYGRHGADQIFIMARLTSAGVLDATFGTAGIVKLRDGLAAPNGTVFASRTECYYYCEVRQDLQGRYVVTSDMLNAAGGTEMLLMRYLSDGTVDTNFNTTGYVYWDNGGAGVAGASGASKWDAGVSLAIDPSTGKYVVAGLSETAGGGARPVVWRYNTDGSIDTTFNTTGYKILSKQVATTAGVTDDLWANIIVESNSKIVIPAMIKNSSGGAESVVFRLKSDGSLDD